jgi:hypothetical protein
MVDSSRFRTLAAAFYFLLVAACAPRDPQRAPVDSLGAAIRALPVGDSGARTLPPVDEADTSFAAFRRVVLAAAQRRDTTFLYSILAPDIKNSFGGDDSVRGFRRMWRMESPDTSRIWGTLTRLLTLGGRMRGGVFVAPYVYAAWPDDVDAFEYVAVTSDHVPAYASADSSSAMVARLSYSILRLEEWSDSDDARSLARVTLPDGRAVWVRSAQIYSPIGWRAFFERRNGRWTMTLLVAGD